MVKAQRDSGPDLPIHFSGNWSPEAKSRVHEAILEYEREARDQVSADGYAWICTVVEIRESRHFFATRVREEVVLRADTVDRLIECIYEYAS